MRKYKLIFKTYEKKQFDTVSKHTKFTVLRHFTKKNNDKTKK